MTQCTRSRKVTRFLKLHACAGGASKAGREAGQVEAGRRPSSDGFDGSGERQRQQGITADNYVSIRCPPAMSEAPWVLASADFPRGNGYVGGQDRCSAGLPGGAKGAQRSGPGREGMSDSLIHIEEAISLSRCKMGRGAAHDYVDRAAVE